MAWTSAALLVFNTALLDKLATGAGTAALKVYTSGDVLLHSYTIDTGASSVHGTTGVLALEEGTASTSVASGVGSYAQLVGEDAAILDDNIPLMEGTTVTPGYLVVSSLTYVEDGASSIISATIG
jgi:hypothetical protein